MGAIEIGWVGVWSWALREGVRKGKKRKDASGLPKSDGHNRQEVSKDTDLNLFVSQCGVVEFIR